MLNISFVRINFRLIFSISLFFLNSAGKMSVNTNKASIIKKNKNAE